MPKNKGKKQAKETKDPVKLKVHNKNMFTKCDRN